MLILLTASLSACGNQPADTSAQDVKQENMQDSTTLLSNETPYILYQIQADSIDDNLKDKVKNTLDERLESLNYGEALVQIEGDDEVAVVFPADVDNVKEIADRLNVTSKLTFEDYQGNVLMTGQDIQEVKVEYGPFTGVNEDGYYLSLEFTETGKSKFKDATAQIAELSEPNNYLAIKLNDEIITTPSVSEAIDSNSCIISGNFDKGSANQLATSIKGTSLPFSLNMVKVNNPNADSIDNKKEKEPESNGNETENIDPEMPYFLQRLGTVKHEDGTYSFKGIITNINLAYGASVYITTANGRQFSTGSTGLINDLRTEVVWNERQGKYVVLFNEILEGRSPGMMEFFYDKDGNYLRFTY